MTTVRRYTDLIAWQKAMDLVEGVYRLTKQFPKEELYGLVSQLRHLSIALGSLGEVETQILIARCLGYPQDEALTALASETGRLVVGLMHSLEKHAAAS